MSGPNPMFLARLVAQHGTAGRWQALEDGHTAGEFAHMVRSGHLERSHHGIYRVAGSPHTPEQTAMSAALRCRPNAAVSGAFVLGLFGIEGFTRFDPFVILVPTGRRVSNVTFPVLVDQSSDLDRATMDGLPIVTAGRALLDAVTELDDRTVLTAIDSMRWRRLLTDERLERHLERCAWHPGAQRIRRLVEEGLTEQESHGERHLARLFDGFEPQPEYQVWVTPKIRVDGLWRDAWMVSSPFVRPSSADVACWSRGADRAVVRRQEVLADAHFSQLRDHGATTATPYPHEVLAGAHFLCPGAGRRAEAPRGVRSSHGARCADRDRGVRQG